MKTPSPILASLGNPALLLILFVALPAGRVRAAALSGCIDSYGATHAFGGGLLVNLNYTNAWSELRLNAQARAFKCLNVPCGDNGTPVRIDVTSGNGAGEYRSAPQGEFSFSANTQRRFPATLATTL